MLPPSASQMVAVVREWRWSETTSHNNLLDVLLSNNSQNTRAIIYQKAFLARFPLQDTTAVRMAFWYPPRRVLMRAPHRRVMHPACSCTTACVARTCACRTWMQASMLTQFHLASWNRPWCTHDWQQEAGRRLLLTRCTCTWEKSRKDMFEYVALSVTGFVDTVIPK